MLNSTPETSASEADDVQASGCAEVELPRLFEEEETNLLRFAFSFVGRREVAEEVVQDAFLRLHHCWAEVESPRAWLYRCTRNRALSHLRKTKREFWMSDEVQADLEIDAEPPAALAIKMDAVAQLRKSLHELPEDDRRLVELRYFEGKKYREISHSVGITIGNVGFRLHRILKQLLRQLQAQGIEKES